MWAKPTDKVSPFVYEVAVEVMKHTRKTLNASGFSRMELIILIAAIVITVIVAIAELRSYQMITNHPPAQHLNYNVSR